MSSILASVKYIMKIRDKYHLGIIIENIEIADQYTKGINDQYPSQINWREVERTKGAR